MKKAILAGLSLVILLVFSGCVTQRFSRNGPASLRAGAGENSRVQADRMIIWKADLSLQVWSISNAVMEVTTRVDRLGGFIDQRSDGRNSSARLTLRIPAKSFQSALSELETLGAVSYRNIHGEDVTEDYIDVAARLNNKKVLRARLQQLLDKATAVKDILAIETELNRVQADIDSMEGRITSLKGQVDFATIELSLERKPILGPLGYVFKGLWWGFEKLFVIRN